MRAHLSGRFVLLALAIAAAGMRPAPARSTDYQIPWPKGWYGFTHPTLSDSGLNVTVQPIVSEYGRELLRVTGGRYAPQQIPLPNDIGFVKEIYRLSSDRLLLVQASTAPYSGFLIYNLTTKKMSGVVACYRPSVSPNHRYIAFVDFYPPHFTELASEQSDFVMLYDTEKSETQNLETRPQATDPGSAEPPIGALLYPKSRKLEAVSVTQGDASADAYPYSVTSDLFWSADSQQLAFRAEHSTEISPGKAQAGDDAKPHLVTNIVLVQMLGGRPHVFTAPYACGPDAESCMLGVQDMRFTETGVSLRLSSGAYAAKPVRMPEMPIAGFTRDE